MTKAEHLRLVTWRFKVLRPDTIVDITHESLIRKWPVLTVWAKDEARSAEWYGDLCRDVLRRRDSQAGLWRDPDRSSVEERRARESWNAHWARQYNPSNEPSFDETTVFLNQSVAATAEERRLHEAQALRERRLKMSLAAAVGVILLSTSIAGVTLYNRSEGARQESRNTSTTAVDLSKRAEESERRAADLEDQLAALRARPSLDPTQDSRRRELEAQLMTERAASAMAQNELDRLKKEVASKQSDSAAIVARVEALQRDLSEANRRVSSLENDLVISRRAAAAAAIQTAAQGPITSPTPTTTIPASAYATETPDIRRLLSDYEDAYNKRSVQLLTRVYPTVPDQKALQDLLNDMSSMKVAIDNPQIALLPSLTFARVTGTFNESFESKKYGSRSSKTSREWFLQKQGGQWYVASLR